jgi:hypothetical protein
MNHFEEPDKKPKRKVVENNTKNKKADVSEEQYAQNKQKKQYKLKKMNSEHKNYGTNGNLIQDRDFYIEEIPSGRTFIYSNELFLITQDSKKDGSRLCFSMKNGNARWLKPNLVVKTTSLYFINQDNNFLPVYENLIS